MDVISFMRRKLSMIDTSEFENRVYVKYEDNQDYPSFIILKDSKGNELYRYAYKQPKKENDK